MKLTPEGLATALAALLVIVVFMAVHAKQQRRARILAKYRRGERDPEVQQHVDMIIERCNVGAGRSHG